MPTPPDPEEINKWHRWFAVECNNRAWDLVEKPERSPGEEEEMLSAAHAAAFHWSKVGQPVNVARADALLARVHVLLGRGEQALAYARRCLNSCDSYPCEDWDLAFAHAEMANAAAAVGDAALHAKHWAAAKQAGDNIKDDADRGVFFEQFSRIRYPTAGPSA